MKSEVRGKKVARLVVAGIGAAVCAVSVLVSLAVLLAFFTEGSDLVGSSLMSRRATMIGVVLFFVSIAVLGLEARRPRRIRRSHAACALLCAAGAAVLIWSAHDDGELGKEQPLPVAVSPPGPSSGWKPGRAGGSAISRGNARRQHAHAKQAPEHSHPAARPDSSPGSTGEGPAAEASAVPYKDECGCEKVEEPYSPPSAEGTPDRGPETEPGWSEPQEAPEEEGWEEPAPAGRGLERPPAAESEAWEQEEESGWEEEEFEEEEEGW
jgi:hypothetical protein